MATIPLFTGFYTSQVLATRFLNHQQQGLGILLLESHGVMAVPAAGMSTARTDLGVSVGASPGGSWGWLGVNATNAERRHIHKRVGTPNVHGCCQKQSTVDLVKRSSRSRSLKDF